MKTLTPLAQSYMDNFETALETLPGAGNRSITALRRQGLDAFSKADFPHKQIEEWRFTPLNALTKKAANEPAFEAGQSKSPAPSFKAAFEMVFINGCYSEDESSLDGLPSGVTLTSLADTLGAGSVLSLSHEEDRSLLALNTAFMEGGFSLHIDDNVKVDGILAITFKNGTSEGPGRHIRNMVSLGKEASASVLENHEGNGAYFSNPVTSISLAEGAELQHYKLQIESQDAFHLALTDCEISNEATYNNFTLSVGGKLSRNELKTTILGSDAESHLNGAYLMRGSQHCDTTTLTEHRVPQNSSSQIYKGVLDDKAHGVFQGKIHIFPDAQQVTGDQLSKALLLSDHAMVDCKPELEIHADDVKCSHGATSGELDDDALFYLQSRGIPEKSARKMLIEAFLADVLETVKDEAVKSYFNDISTAWLAEA